MQLNDTTNLIGIKQDLYFTGGFNSNTYTANDLNRIINKYYKILQEDIRSINEDFFLVSSKADIPVFIPNVAQSFNFPTDYEKVKSFWAATTPVNLASPLSTEYARCTVIEPNAITSPSYIFTIPTVSIFGGYFILYPILSNASIIVGGMKIYYIPIQADLALDTDVPNIFPDYHDAITAGSLIDIGRRMGKSELVAEAQKTFTRRRLELRADISNRILNFEEEYVEGQSSQGGWAFPYGKQGI